MAHCTFVLLATFATILVATPPPKAEDDPGYANRSITLAEVPKLRRPAESLGAVVHIAGNDTVVHEPSAGNITQSTQVSAPATAAPLGRTPGACSANDEVALQHLGKSFPKIIADCESGAKHWFSGFHKDEMAQRIKQKTGLSDSCTHCFVAAGEYANRHCRIECFFGRWCSALCQGCTGKQAPNTQKCVGEGISIPQQDRQDRC